MNEEAQILFDRENSRNWQCDYTHENGSYINTCLYCERKFVGHKRRVSCRECYCKPSEEEMKSAVTRVFGIWREGPDHIIIDVKSEGFSKLEKEIAEKQQAQSTAHFLRTEAEKDEIFAAQNY